jgi:hypothetical protein
MRAAALFLALPLMPAVAAAQQAPTRSFQPPAGCTAYMTVQMADCTVSHHFTCEGDPAGWQRRVDMDEQGITYFGAIDSETQWMESYHVLSGHSERLLPGAADPASFTELTTRNIDTYDFRTESDEIGITRYVGQDRLTGETVVIDGVTLERTEFAIRVLDAEGNEQWRAAGNEYISREYRLFLGGTSTITTPDDVWETDGSPVEFFFPGEPGFLSATPRHGCGVVMSSLPLAALPHEEISDDGL